MMMAENSVVKVHTLSDSLEARLLARQLAREVGFNLQDQAYISLATWELAVRLGLGISRQGMIFIDPVEKERSRGIRIICKTKNVKQTDLDFISSGEIKSLVDEVHIQQPRSSGSDIEIAVTKWER